MPGDNRQVEEAAVLADGAGGERHRPAVLRREACPEWVGGRAQVEWERLDSFPELLSFRLSLQSRCHKTHLPAKTSFRFERTATPLMLHGMELREPVRRSGGHPVRGCNQRR